MSSGHHTQEQDRGNLTGIVATRVLAGEVECVRCLLVNIYRTGQCVIVISSRSHRHVRVGPKSVGVLSPAGDMLSREGGRGSVCMFVLRKRESFAMQMSAIERAPLTQPSHVAQIHGNTRWETKARPRAPPYRSNRLENPLCAEYHTQCLHGPLYNGSIFPRFHHLGGGIDTGSVGREPIHRRDQPWGTTADPTSRG